MLQYNLLQYKTPIVFITHCIAFSISKSLQFIYKTEWCRFFFFYWLLNLDDVSKVSSAEWMFSFYDSYKTSRKASQSQSHWMNFQSLGIDMKNFTLWSTVFCLSGKNLRGIGNLAKLECKETDDKNNFRLIRGIHFLCTNYSCQWVPIAALSLFLNISAKIILFS